MTTPTIDDDLWQLIQPLLPTPPRGIATRPQTPERPDLPGGILFVLTTGIRWDRLPQQLGYGSGMTCWRRLRDWHQAGVLDHLHQLLLARLHQAQRLDWSRAVMDAAHIRALKGGGDRRKPVDRGRAGSKHHLVCAASGVPLAVSLTGGNAHDVTQLLALIDRIPPVRGRPGRPRRRPAALLADRGYDFDRYRRELRRRRIRAVTARRGSCTAQGSAASAGSWNARWPGCTSSNGCGSAGSGVLTSARHSSSWPAA